VTKTRLLQYAVKLIRSVKRFVTKAGEERANVEMQSINGNLARTNKLSISLQKKFEENSKNNNKSNRNKMQHQQHQQEQSNSNSSSNNTSNNSRNSGSDSNNNSDCDMDNVNMSISSKLQILMVYSFIHLGFNEADTFKANLIQIY
jgi:hypothetical protein